MRFLALLLVCALLSGCASPSRQDNQTQPIQVVKCVDTCSPGGGQVCGTDGRTYQNLCYAGCSGAELASEGPCGNVSCQDSDAGQNPYMKGTARTTAEAETDRCKSPTEVYEYYCGAAGIMNITMSCPAGTGCIDGACVNQSSQGCSGGGTDIYTQGTVDRGRHLLSGFVREPADVEEIRMRRYQRG